MLRCRECGEDNDADARRCTQCGEPLAAPGPEDSGPGSTEHTLVGRHASEAVSDRPPDAAGGDDPTRVRPAALTDVMPAGHDLDACDEELEETRVRPTARAPGGEVPATERSHPTIPHEATLVSHSVGCAACGGTVRSSWRFCKNCGAPLVEGAEKPRWRHALVEVSRPGGPARRTLDLENEITVFGRRLADVVLDDSAVSGSHAALEVDDEGCHVRDLDSTNGTFVAVRGFEALWPGAVILAGPHRLLYRRRQTCLGDGRELVLVAAGGREKAAFPLEAEPVAIGTSRGDIALPSARGVASRHAEIAWTGSAHAVRGLSPQHPTWLLVRRRRRLQDQDRLRLGETVYEYRRLRE